MTKKLQKVETIKEQISKAIDGHLTPEYIEKRVHEIIGKNTNDVILKLLGFDSTWHGGGKYEVDHCNGRSGESFIGDYITEQAKDKLKAWIDKTNISEVVLPKSAIQDMEKEFISIYTHNLRRHLTNRAEVLAKLTAEQYLKDLISEIPSVDDVLDEEKIVKKNPKTIKETIKVVGLSL